MAISSASFSSSLCEVEISALIPRISKLSLAIYPLYICKVNNFCAVELFDTLSVPAKDTSYFRAFLTQIPNAFPKTFYYNPFQSIFKHKFPFCLSLDK